MKKKLNQLLGDSGIIIDKFTSRFSICKGVFLFLLIYLFFLGEHFQVCLYTYVFLVSILFIIKIIMKLNPTNQTISKVYKNLLLICWFLFLIICFRFLSVHEPGMVYMLGEIELQGRYAHETMYVWFWNTCDYIHGCLWSLKGWWYHGVRHPYQHYSITQIFGIKRPTFWVCIKYHLHGFNIIDLICNIIDLYKNCPTPHEYVSSYKIETWNNDFHRYDNHPAHWWESEVTFRDWYNKLKFSSTSWFFYIFIWPFYDFRLDNHVVNNDLSYLIVYKCNIEAYLTAANYKYFFIHFNDMPRLLQLFIIYNNEVCNFLNAVLNVIYKGKYFLAFRYLLVYISYYWFIYLFFRYMIYVIKEILS